MGATAAIGGLEMRSFYHYQDNEEPTKFKSRMFRQGDQKSKTSKGKFND
jgi:hypothetical protein